MLGVSPDHWNVLAVPVYKDLATGLVSVSVYVTVPVKVVTHVNAVDEVAVFEEVREEVFRLQIEPERV